MQQLFKTLLISISLLLSSCAPSNILPSENIRMFKRSVPIYKTGQTVRIHNSYKKPMPVKVVTQSTSDTIETDLQKYTQSVVKLMEQGLEKRDVYSTSDSNKVIKIKVHDIIYDSSKTGWTSGLRITAELNSGKSISIEKKFTGFGLLFAVNKSVEKATAVLLKHPEFVAYINQ